ncbi:ABC transporter permease [Enterococcus sp. 2201sp1_2201st1_B8_2201SCRN_220225]|uniref:ABC transporter permease n=1 Tax=unclassified Enterococcus TaxID=2608891 RepID=UPI0034A4FFD4
MKLMINWRSSLRAILKNKKRSLLTMFGIVIGIAAVIAILSIGRGFERDTIKSITQSDSEEVTVEVQYTPSDNMMYEANVNFFNDQDLQLVENIQGVKKADYLQYETDTYYVELPIKNKKVNKEIKVVSQSKKEPLVGRALTKYDNEVLNRVTMIDSITAEALFGSSEKALNQGLELEGQLFQIVGVFEGTEQSSMFSMPESNILVPRKAYAHYQSQTQDQSTLQLTLEDGVNPGDVTTEAIDTLEENGSQKDQGEYQVFDTALLTEGVGQVLSTITYFIGAVAGISLFIAGVGVMNMMYISVSERTKEIGIRRALGATRGAIRLQFLLEGMTLTLIGGVVGYLLGMALAYIIGGFVNISVSVDLFTVLLAVGVSTGIGLVFSVMPASEAAKKDLIDILR